MTLEGRILLVDDEPRNLIILKELLGSYELQSATSGREALQKTACFRPDIVLLDVVMPELDGHEVCRRIRADKENRFLKVIFVSGKAMVGERLLGYRAGGDDYLIKPYDHEELLAKIRVFLRLKHTEQLNQLKSDFLSLISHETRAPLTGIMGLSDFIVSDPDATLEDIRGYARSIHVCGKQMASFLDKATLLCSLKSNATPTMALTSMRSLVRAAVEDLAEDFAFYKLEHDTQVDDLILLADESLLVKALGGILENAMQLVPQYGSIAITGRLKGARYVLSVSTQGETENDASGEARQLEDLRASSIAAHSCFQGLSIAVARRIASVHGGGMHVEGREGKTSFTLWIPAGTPSGGVSGVPIGAAYVP